MQRVRRILALFLTSLVGCRCPGCGEPCREAPCARCCAQLAEAPGARGAAWLDTGVAARLVRAAKAGRWRGGGEALARLVLEQRRYSLPACDVVTWIPADRSRRAERGGHLPERFARALARRRGVEAMPLLAATRRRRPQRGLGRAARVRNMAGAFRVVRSPGADTHVLVVDDVRTTGATLAAARAALRHLPMHVATFAIVGVDRPPRRATGVGNSARCEEIRLTNRTIRADESGILRKGSSLLAPRPP